jgi:hypothetical protein
MVLRFPLRLLVVVMLLAVAAGSGSAVRGEEPLRQSSSVEAARARFLARIREMLSEAATMDAAGRREDAMLVAVRASRMLDALGGESAWPRGEATPAQVVAILSEKRGPSAKPERLPARTDIRSGEVLQTAADSRLAKPAPARSAVTSRAAPVEAKRPSAFSRFPRVPAVSRSWVPVGEPVRDAQDWTPVGEIPRRTDARPIAQAGVELPFPSATETERTARMQVPVFRPEGGGAETGGSVTISDTHVGPIPIHLTPEVRPAAGIDIRAGEHESQPDSFGHDPSPDQPLEFRPIAEPVPIPVIRVEPPEVQPLLPDDSVEAGQPESQASRGGQTPEKVSATAIKSGPGEVAADNSRLLLATLSGAVGGIFLVLAGGFLVRRLSRFSVDPLDNRLQETVSPAAKATPAKATPAKATPAKATPAKATPAKATPAKATPAKATPTKATQGSMVKLSIAQPGRSETAWQPGSSWVESDSQPASAVPYPVQSEADSSEETEPSPQLQIYHEVLEPEAVPEAYVALATTGSDSDTVANSESAPPVNPAVPFRVIGTSVVLGDAAADQVDEELQQRRRTVMQAVVDENLARQGQRNEESSEAA